DQRRDRLAGFVIQSGEGAAPPRGEGEFESPGILGRVLANQEARLDEALQNPAEVPRIEPQLASQFTGGGALARAQLEQDPGLGEGKRTGEQRLLQYPDPLCVEAVEAADR